MVKERKSKTQDDIADSRKMPQNFRFTRDTVRRLEIAAAQYGMSKTSYTELALKDRFKRDHIN